MWFVKNPFFLLSGLLYMSKSEVQKLSHMFVIQGIIEDLSLSPIPDEVKISQSSQMV